LRAVQRIGSSSHPLKKKRRFSPPFFPFVTTLPRFRSQCLFGQRKAAKAASFFSTQREENMPRWALTAVLVAFVGVAVQVEAADLDGEFLWAARVGGLA